MLRAALCALGACALWALAFVAPPLADASAGALTLSRYLVFGLSSVIVLAAVRFNPWRRLSRRDWWRVIALGLTGNTLCYGLMAAGVLAAGPAPVAFIFATLPMAMVLVGNLRRPAIRWGALAGPAVLVVAGLAVTGFAAMAADDGISGASPAVGLVLAVLALLSWVVYGIWNAEYLSAHPRTDLVVWASLTGLGTLITLPLLLAVEVALSGPPPLALPPVPLVAWGLILGLGAAWLPTWLWGIASARIAASTLGMLLVGEALFALLYACIVEGRLPRAAEAIAAVLTVGGVLWGLRAARAARRPGPVPPSETGQAAPAR